MINLHMGSDRCHFKNAHFIEIVYQQENKFWWHSDEVHL